MNALTKVFVGLLIVCSLLLAAATVVFVNRTDDFRRERDEAKARIDRLGGDKQAALDHAAAARAREEKAVAESLKTVADLQGQVSSLKQDVTSKDNGINELKMKLAVEDAAITELANAQKIGQINMGDLHKRHDTLVTEYDKIRLNNAELVGANTDYQKRLDVSEREARMLAEQNTQMKKEMADAKNLLAKYNIPLEAARKPIASNLKGVIREITTHDGVKYATISIGSSDKVEKGMQFNVVDPDARVFLGKFTVEAVEPTSAFGRLEGPRVQDVQPNSQVLSEL